MPTPAATLSRPRPESLNFRARALECRMIAARFRVDFARSQMLKTADDFERIAHDEREREIVHGIAELGALVRKVHEAG
ncbi:MAG: hypothetical protein ACREB2_05840 [Pseudolabrys sp.]